MDDDIAMSTWIDRLLPERLRWLSRSSEMPVVFGGTISPAASWLVLSRLMGTFGTGLHGLQVRAGSGLGGSVLRDRWAQRVDDYARTASITHEYDPIVVRQERLTSMFAVPVIVRGAVRGVLYGAVRDHRPVGDRTLRHAEILATQLERDVEQRLRPEPEWEQDDPLAELAAVIDEAGDPALRARLSSIHRRLGGQRPPSPSGK